MHRLLTLATALTVAGAVLAGPGNAEAQDRKQAKPPPKSPPVILRERRQEPPPQPEPKYYGPAPSIQPPMRRVPLPEPLAEPPIRR